MTRPAKFPVLPQGVRHLRTLEGHQGWISRLAFSADGRHLASSANDGTVRVWDCVTGGLRWELEAQSRLTFSVAWSSDARTLATDYGTEVQLWDAWEGQPLETARGSVGTVLCLAWSPRAELLAYGLDDHAILVWDVRARVQVAKLVGHRGAVQTVAWAPDGRSLASGAQDHSIFLWEAASFERTQTLRGHKDWIVDLAFTPDGERLVSCSNDKTIRVWNLKSGLMTGILEQHQGAVVALALSADGRLLASKSHDGTVRIWDFEKLKELVVLSEPASMGASRAGLSFHPTMPWLVSLGDRHRSIELWELDLTVLLGDAPRSYELPADPCAAPVVEAEEVPPTLEALEEQAKAADEPESRTYAELVNGVFSHPALNPDVEANLDMGTVLDSFFHEVDRAQSACGAKVVLVGESGVGKSSLAAKLAGASFQPTESTHGRRVQRLEVRPEDFEAGGVALPQENERAELHLWDLAGQPGYRVLHQLHLDDVAAAIVLFDPRSEQDPFGAVAYWARALDAGAREQPVAKLLVASRIDRAGPPIAREKIQDVLKRFGFLAYYETSSRTGVGVPELRRALLKAVAWKSVPRVAQPGLCEALESWIAQRRRAGELLITRDSLSTRFRRDRPDLGAEDDGIAAALRLLESAGEVRTVPGQSVILLEGDILDDYGAWLLYAARRDPDGLGALPLQQVIDRRIEMDPQRRLAHRAEDEVQVLKLAVQEMLRRKLAFGERAPQGPVLLFPSEMVAESKDPRAGCETAISFRFEGSVRAIYASLAVRLLSGAGLKKRALYSNAAHFVGSSGGVQGVELVFPEPNDDALGELHAFFESRVEEEERQRFLLAIQEHLRALALPGSVQTRREYRCGTCSNTVPQQAVAFRRKAGFPTALCAFCGSEVPLDEAEASSHASTAPTRHS
ncbi:MAG: hypothetical protein IPN34_03465 [Planctomycetes bacterium]|nr:hypothetical protein [Planctomycetota bacterium]